MLNRVLTHGPNRAPNSLSLSSPSKSQNSLSRAFCIANGTIYQNQHIRAIQSYNLKDYAYDNYITKYSTIVKAYLSKRWTKKKEVWPKAYIIDEAESMKSSLDQQELSFLKNLLPLSAMTRQADMGQIDPQFVMSAWLEEDFKPFLDQVAKKTVMNGDQPPMEVSVKEKDNRNKLIELFRRFHFGDELTSFEETVEHLYLERKKDKFLKFHITQGQREFNVQYLESDARRTAGAENYILRNLEYYDDFKIIWRPIDQEGYQANLLKKEELEGLNSLGKKLMGLLMTKDYGLNLSRYEEWASQVFYRIYEYIKSVEFTHLMDLPPDYHIEYGLLNFHIWLIIRSIQRHPSKKSELMWRALQNAFEKHSKNDVNTIHLKKKNDFIKDLKYFSEMNRTTFEYHFIGNHKTAQNPYLKVDALVWSTIYFEKVDRFSDRVYLLAEYCVRQFKWAMGLSLEEIEAGQIDFDIYRTSLDYKGRIQGLNPPMTEEELEEELLSDRKVKKFYYNYEEEGMEMPIDEEQKRVISHRYDFLLRKMLSTANKFQTFETYDKYSDREETEEEIERKEKKYPWAQRGKLDDNV